MADIETWKFINTFAPWLSAIGTFAAVVTSLYLARRSDRISLKVHFGIRKVAVQGIHATSPDFFWANVTNLGRREATLTNLYFIPYPWKKSGFGWIPPQNRFSSEFPITLADGRSANYAGQVDQIGESFKNFAREHYSGKLGAFRVRFLIFRVGISTGRQFSAIPENNVRQALLEIARTAKTIQKGSAQAIAP